jgi:hypothetical protein
MKCRFNELDAEGNYTDYISVLTEGGCTPDWVDVELTNTLTLELAMGILQGNPEFNTIILNNKCGFAVDADPDNGRWEDATLVVTTWGGYYILLRYEYAEVEVDITEMVRAFKRGENYEPRS